MSIREWEELCSDPHKIHLPIKSGVPSAVPQSPEIHSIAAYRGWSSKESFWLPAVLVGLKHRP